MADAVVETVSHIVQVIVDGQMPVPLDDVQKDDIDDDLGWSDEDSPDYREHKYVDGDAQAEEFTITELTCCSY